MPYSVGPFIAPHLYLQWGGKLPGNEQWSCGVRMAQRNTGPWPGTDAAGMIAAVKTAVQAFHVRGASLISNEAKLSFVKLNPIDVDGHYSLQTTNEVIVADVPGGYPGGNPPNQNALVATLETGFSRGPAHQGRFYIPLPMGATQADGLITVSDATAVKGSVTTLIADLNAVSVKYGVAVFSRKSGAPALRMVTGCTVGRAIDTQRRRRKSLNEARV